MFHGRIYRVTVPIERWENNEESVDVPVILLKHRFVRARPHRPGCPRRRVRLGRKALPHFPIRVRFR